MRENESEIAGLTIYDKLQNRKKKNEFVNIWVLMFL